MKFTSGTKREKYAFSHIKKEIIEAPAFYIPYFNKGFFLYTFSYNISLVIVLKPKDVQNNEWPISFMSAILQGAELNYLSINQQYYEVYKAMKYF